MTPIQFGIRLTADGAQAAGEMARFGRAVGDVRGELDAATAAAATHGGAVKSLTGVVAGYAAAAASAFGAGKLASAADEWGQLASRLDIAAGSADAAAEATDRLMEVSNRTYKSFANSAELYIRTGDSLAELGISADQALGMVEALQYGLTVSSANQEKSARVIDAWSKAILNGKMGLEEYQTVVAAAPRLQKALADSLGVTNAELQQMVSDGKITADVLVGVSSQVQRLGQEADRMPVTLADSFQRLDNQITRFAGNAEANVGVIRAVTTGVTALGDNIELVVAAAGVAGVAALGRYAGALVSTAAAKARTALATRDALAAEVKYQHAAARSAAAEASVALSSNAAAAARQRLAAATEAAAIAQGKMLTGAGLARGAIAAMGGPIGALIAVLGTAAIAWTTFGDRAESATERARRGIDAALERVRQLNAEQQFGAGDAGLLNQSLEQIDSRLRVLNQSKSAAAQAEAVTLVAKRAEIEATLQRIESGGMTARQQANARYATYLADRRSLSEQLRTDLETELQAFTAATRGIEAGSTSYAAAQEAYNRKTAEIRARYARKDGAQPRDRDLNAGFDTAAASAYASAIDALVRIQRDAGAEGQQLTRSQLALRELMLSPEWGRMPEPWRRVVEEMAAMADEAERAGEKAARLTAMLAETDSAKIERARADVQLLVDALERGEINAATFSEATAARLGLVGDTARDTKNEFEELTRAVEGFGKDAASAIVDFALTGKTSFGDMVTSMLADIAKLLVYQNVTKPLTNQLSGVNWGGLFSGLLASAKGNAFAGAGPVQAFAAGGAFGDGEILTQPTFFRFAAGGAFRDGVAGEAGPEAALPLKRLPNGKLGVYADVPVSAPGTHGATPAAAPRVQVTINNTAGQRMEARSQATMGSDGTLNLEVTLYERVKGRLIRDTQQGGGLAPVLENRYGLNPAAGARY